MRILLRCDVGPDTRAGHLVRSVAVAEALKARGHEPLLCAAVEEPWVQELITDAGVQLLPAGPAADLLALAGEHGADFVHLDGPGAGPLVDGRPHRTPRLSVLADDSDRAGTTGAATAFDLLVAPTLGRSSVDTSGGADGIGPVVASGPEYAPVRTAVVEARERRQWRAGGMGDRLRVLVVLGAEDAARTMLDAVQALAASDLTTDVLVVAPSTAVGMAAEGLSTRSVRVLATSRRGDLPRLVADHDLVVTRPGPILWELCCIGTPAALVPLTAAEEAATARWVDAGVAVAFSLSGGASRAAGQLRALLRDGMRRADLGTAGLRLVDGEGAARVAGLIEQVAAAAG